jgi:hypothetical protein
VTRGRSWRCRWSIRVAAEVGAVEGTDGPWCLESTVRDGDGEEREVELGLRLGWRARNATNGYVVV